MSRIITIISAIVAVISVISGLTFASQSRTAQNQATKLEASLHQAEKDLIYYQNTDLAKEVELLNLKLANAKQDLAASQKTATTAQARVETLEVNHGKIPGYLSAIDAIEDLTANEGPTAAKLSIVDAKINALADQAISNRWYSGGGRSSVDIEHKSWGTGLYETEEALTARIRELIK